MAEEKPKKPASADDKLGLGVVDVNSLLDAAQESLKDVGAELGSEPGGKEAQQTTIEDAAGVEKDSPKRVEQTLADLERDLLDLNKQTDDSGPEGVADEETPQNSGNTNEDVDAILANLTEELESTTDEKTTKATDNVSQDVTGEAAQDVTDPKGEETGTQTDIDDVLASLAGELANDEPETKPQAVALPAEIEASDEDHQQVEDEIERLFSQQTNQAAVADTSEINKTVEEPEPSESADIDSGNDDDDASAAEEKESPEDALAQAAAALDDVAEDTESNIVEEESVEASQSQESKDSLDDAVPDVPLRETADNETTEPEEPKPPVEDPYAHFPPAQQVLVRTMAACNKPFTGFVGETTRDTLGLIGIITVIVAFLAAGISLMFK